MKEFSVEHIFPLSPEQLMEILDEDAYRDFVVARMPNLVDMERLEFRWEEGRRIRRTRLKFDTPIPALIKRALPSNGEGWIEEMNILYPAERRMESTMVSSATKTVRIVHFHEGGRPEQTRRVSHSTMEASVPLVGRALEKFMEREAHRQKDAEFEITMDYIKTRS